MKLELKHLAPYLPYGLKYVKYSYNNSPIRHDIMQGVSTNGIYACGDITPLSFKNCKPILRPLSDLTKLGSNERWWMTTIDLGITKLGYESIQELLEEHYDIFNLIEKGLAIDINTLEN
tara:strand:- start:391 stop:747 length:357 start_codon:yes stop_codon:yes gene_type:complete